MYISVFFLLCPDGFTSPKLLRLSKKLTSVNDLRRLGIDGLRLEATKVDSCKQNNPNDIISAAYDLLTEWSKSQPNKITASKNIREALKRAEMSSLIVEIR